MKDHNDASLDDLRVGQDAMKSPKEIAAELVHAYYANGWTRDHLTRRIKEALTTCAIECFEEAARIVSAEAILAEKRYQDEPLVLSPYHSNRLRHLGLDADRAIRERADEFLGPKP